MAVPANSSFPASNVQDVASYPVWIWLFPIGWTLLVVMALWWNMSHVQSTIHRLASAAAQSSIEKDILYRQWAAMHGGMYVPVTHKTPANPFLSTVSERDIQTPSGRELTLMNPAYMTRQVHELGRELYSPQGHITSLKPLRPENAPDPWERQALETLERGAAEVSSIELINGKPHMRMIRPLKDTADCLKCHASQGYKEGDIRGGLSVSVPIRDYEESVHSHHRAELLAHGSIWGLGMAVFSIGAWQLQRRLRERADVEIRLRQSEEKYHLAMDAVSDGLWDWNVRSGTVHYSAAWAKMLGETSVEPVYASWEKRIHPEDKECVLRLLKEHLDDNSDLWQCEHRLSTQTGDWKWILGRGRVIARDKDGSPLRMLGMMQDISARKRAELALKNLATSFAHLSGKSFFEAVSRHLAVSLNVDYVFVGQYRPETHCVTVLGGYARGESMAEMNYNLAGTPCERVVGRELCCYPMDVQARFPKDELLVQMGIEGYLGAPVFDKQQNPIGILVALHSRSLHNSQEISNLFQIFVDRVSAEMQRSNAQEELERNEKRMRLFFERQLVGMAITTEDKSWVQVNDRLCQILGYSRQELIQKTWAELTHPDDLNGEVAQYENMLSGKTDDYSMEQRFIRKDGATVHAVLSIVSVRLPSGSIEYLLALVEDISDRKRAEEALRESNRMLEGSQRQARVGGYVLDLRSGQGRCSAMLCEIFGFKNPDAPHSLKEWEDLLHPEDRVATRDHLHRFIAEKHGVFERQYRIIRTSDRSELWLNGQGTLILDAEGNPVQMIGIVQDITAQKQLEEQARRSQKMEAIGQLAGGVAHDFNNILAAMMMNLDLLQQKPNLDREVTETMQELKAEAKRAASLTRQLLMFSRRSVLEKRVLDLNEVVANLLKMLGRLLGEHIALVFERRNTLPTVEADAGMLEQVLLNLTVNARDAMPQGGRITLATEAVQIHPDQVSGHPDRRAGQFVCLSASDTGCGMDSATLKRIFEPFFTTKPAGSGTGLGLATVYGIVAQHGGWVEVDSQLGKGSAFRIYLPAIDKPLPELQQAVAQPVRGGTESLLVVEDEPSVRRLLVTTLQKLGYKVHAAANGIEAQRLWREQGPKFDLLLSDMVMPEGMTGLQLAEQVRAEKPDIKVIISSGYSAEMVHNGVVPGHGFAYLPKPYQMSLLGKMVRDCLDGK